GRWMPFLPFSSFPKVDGCQLGDWVSTALDARAAQITTDKPMTKERSVRAEPHQTGAPDHGAVDRERCEGAGLEVPRQIAHREVGADEGGDAAGDDLTVDPRSELSE